MKKLSRAFYILNANLHLILELNDEELEIIKRNIKQIKKLREGTSLKGES